MIKTSCFALALVGCIAQDQEPAPTPGMFSRTVVTLGPDGPVASTTQITAAEQQAELRAREEAVAHPGTLSVQIAQDSCANGNALWIYDQANLTGNEICFSGSGTTLLSSYQRWLCTATTCYIRDWSGAVRSFWAGNDDGWFIQNGGFYDHFTPFQRTPLADGTASAAQWLQLR